MQGESQYEPRHESALLLRSFRRLPPYRREIRREVTVTGQATTA